MYIGVLGLQGAYAKHFAMLNSLKIKPVNIRWPDELESCDGLIIPGGESTTITKLLKENELQDALVQFAKEKPVFGTCAGMILMAKSVEDSSVQTLNLIDINVDRNGYGRQVHSFIDDLDINLNGKKPDIGIVPQSPERIFGAHTPEEIGKMLIIEKLQIIPS